MEDDLHGHRQQPGRSHLGELLDDDHLGVLEGGYPVFELEWVVVIVICLDGTCPVHISVLLRVKTVRILASLYRLGLRTVVYTLLQVVLIQVHLCNNSLQSYKLVCHSTVKTPRSHEVSTQITFHLDREMLNLLVYFTLFLILI